MLKEKMWKSPSEWSNEKRKIGWGRNVNIILVLLVPFISLHNSKDSLTDLALKKECILKEKVRIAPVSMGIEQFCLSLQLGSKIWQMNK